MAPWKKCLRLISFEGGKIYFDLVSWVLLYIHLFNCLELWWHNHHDGTVWYRESTYFKCLHSQYPHHTHSYNSLFSMNSAFKRFCHTPVVSEARDQSRHECFWKTFKIQPTPCFSSKPSQCSNNLHCGKSN